MGLSINEIRELKRLGDYHGALSGGFKKSFCQSYTKWIEYQLTNELGRRIYVDSEGKLVEPLICHCIFPNGLGQILIEEIDTVYDIVVVAFRSQLANLRGFAKTRETIDPEHLLKLVRRIPQETKIVRNRPKECLIAWEKRCSHI